LLARQLDHPLSLAYALTWTAFLHTLHRDVPHTRTQAETAVAFSAAQGFAHWLAVSIVMRGWALVVAGQPAEGLTQMHQGLDAYRATQAEIWVPYLLALLADGYGHAGQPTEGLRLVAEALARVQYTQERWCEAELHRLYGELLLQIDPQSNAQSGEAHVQQALAIARQQEAKTLELRAAIRLSRLWQQQGKCEAARALLAGVHGWFTEGFDTPDGQEATALLSALGRRGAPQPP
jgi:predicted ATPase